MVDPLGASRATWESERRSVVSARFQRVSRLSAQRKGAHLAPPHPRHEEEPRDPPPRAAALVPALDRQRSAGSRRGPGPSVPRPGSARQRGGPGSTPPPPAVEVARRRPALVVELGEVGGQRRVLERPAVEPSVEAAERPGVGAAGVRADGGLREAARDRRWALKPGRGGAGRGGARVVSIFTPAAVRATCRRASETRTSPGSSWWSGMIQTMRASTRRRPRSAGVSAGIPPTASSSMRNQTWSPSVWRSEPTSPPLCSPRPGRGRRAVRPRNSPGDSRLRKAGLPVPPIAIAGTVG